MNWHLETEYVALVLLGILAFYSRERTKALLPRTRLYRLGLYVSALATALNIVASSLLQSGISVPYGVNMAVNTAYFLFIVLACSLMAIYLLLLLFEHAPSRKPLRVTGLIVAALYIAYALLIALNVRQGWVFRIGADGGYTQGPLIYTGYGVLILNTLLVLVCYLRHRAFAPLHVVRVIQTLPFFALLVFALQLTCPSMPLGGMLTAVVNLVLFINFQNQKLTQDALTRLSNRAAFFTDLGAALRRDESVHVVLLSLKHFELVNRKFTHRCGDEFLYLVARWLEGVSPGSRAYRYGNVEFALIRPYVDLEETSAFMHALQRRFTQDWQLQLIHCVLTASFADILCLRTAEDENKIAEYLEYALELSKYAGEANWARFDDSTRRLMERRVHVLASLQTAVQSEQGRFGVYYQPIYTCKSGSYNTLEALLRLRDRDGTPIAPDEFIPLAEETGLIGELTWILLEKVCVFLQRNASLPIDSVSVNLSAQQFLDPRLLTRLDDILQSHGVAAARIKIEITERVISDNLESTRSAMRQLIARGISFYLDDFGMGYSNFSSALALPFECIKIDRSLVAPIADDEKSLLLVRSIVEAFHSMGAFLVAEGVETASQLSIIQKLGIDRVQGYYYARPMDEDAVVRFL